MPRIEPAVQTEPHSVIATTSRARGGRSWLTGGGDAGNEQLTAITGVVLLIMLAVIGVTIVRIGQLISVHLFVGFLLLGPVALKMASTGYRFVRYYMNDPVYRHKGPPQIVLRLIAPVLVILTLVVFASGIALMFDGPAHRDPMLLIHKVSFIVWLVFASLHVLGHLADLPGALRASSARRHVDRLSTGALSRMAPGSTGRSLAIAGVLVGGVVLALVMSGQFSSWTAHGVLVHHHHHG